ncbi:MAG: 23S rRNA pseudouridine(1911/1915/1917) synthase RluD [Gammaproteobacteria bacterium]|nr:23S rRNA pseudouridine(1911/1915/1917) synthase RluD [Gammaproteobacteria bacterium]MBT8132867.1 23S rRNA pseudouridine(1911/1915/1917) synthase RluD [Gammaproteobacteria bacterium]NNJ50195.1 23S rRNA pseudouridine(1911/1915/1917) synthase RluD [Gammaproteobacteria bacterium]
MSEPPIIKHLTEESAGKRLDVVLANIFPEYSRSRLKLWIEQGQVLVNGEVVKPKHKMSGDEQLQLSVQSIESEENCVAEDIPLDIVYQDESIIVINKPADFVVHPAAGHYSGTMQNALLHHDAALAEIPRAGIVHRLDKDTTGLMVVARNLRAHKYLVDQIQKHDVIREYQAVVYGVMTGGGMVDQPIGRHPRDRIKMAVRENGREAITHYRLLQRFREHSHIKVQLETGRTHQIRVHMSHLHHPIVGDPVYAGRHRVPAGAQQELLDCLHVFKRQALHAWRLSFAHPVTGEDVTFEAALPDDMQQLIKLLQADLLLHEASNKNG